MPYHLESGDSGEVAPKHHVAIQNFHFTLKPDHELLHGAFLGELSISACTTQTITIAFYHFSGVRSERIQLLLMSLSLLVEFFLSFCGGLVGLLLRGLLFL